MKRKKIGQLLLRDEVLTESQLKEALQIQEDQQTEGIKRFLGEILVELGYCTEKEIASYLSEQTDYVYLPLARYDVDSKLIEKLGSDFAKTHQVVPVDQIGSIVTVATPVVLDAEVIEQLGKVFDANIKVFISTISEVRSFIDRHYGEKGDS